jgi:hypothetical protein
MIIKAMKIDVFKARDTDVKWTWNPSKWLLNDHQETTNVNCTQVRIIF